MLESKYIKETPLNYRKNYGQFFTPSSVARLMVKWVLRDNPKTILDPAFGLGVFYDETIKIKPNSQIFFSGYEIDNRIINFFNYHANNFNCRVNNQDYLQTEAGFFDGIICNPPYMRFQKFLNRHQILPKIEKKIGKKLVGYVNISSVFLLKSLKELKVNGNLAYIMPFEFFNAGYGKQIKKFLLDNNFLKQIVIFSNEKEIFPEAITTVCMLLCKNDGKQNSIKITIINTNEEIEKIADISNFYQKEIPPSDLPYNKKWTPLILSLFSEQKIPDDFSVISSYGTFSRGIATGANVFFSLTKSEIEKWKLDGNNLCKCITKSFQIKKPLFTESDFNILYKADKPVHCLDVKKIDNQQVIEYIKEGEKLGYHQRYLTKKRNTWYKIENRKPAPILFGVFNRGRLKVIRNFTTAINFTCFHSFYPNMYGQQLVNKLFIYLISEIGQSIIKNNKRSYGDGLDKFEPGDLNDGLCPNQKQFEMIGEQDVRKVINLINKDEKAAIQISNNLIEKIINAS